MQQFQPLLTKFEDDSNLVVTGASEEPGSKMGDNYMSVVVRTKILGKRGNGKPYSRTFMVKCFPQKRKTTEFFRTSDLFYIESHVYNKILPVLGSFGPECIYADSQYVIMEDLKEIGYSVCDRQYFLDLNHCLFTLQKLATLHAKSLAMKILDPVNFEKLTGPLKEAVFPQDDRPAVGMFFDGTLTRTLNNLKSLKEQTEEIKKVMNFLEEYQGKYYKAMQKTFGNPKERYHVLCHGDPWTNNLLFKHDPKGKIVDLKMVDYQIVRHTSPAIDFHYFVYTSARSSVIHENYDDLINAYFDTLKQELDNCNVPDEEVKDLTVDWFKKELEKFYIYGMISGFVMANVHLVDAQVNVNMDEVTTEEIMDIEKLNMPILPKVAERMGQIAIHCARTYLRD